MLSSSPLWLPAEAVFLFGKKMTAKPTTTYLDTTKNTTGFSTASPEITGYLLKQDGDYLLQQNGDRIILNTASDVVKKATSFTATAKNTTGYMAT